MCGLMILLHHSHYISDVMTFECRKSEIQYLEKNQLQIFSFTWMQKIVAKKAQINKIPNWKNMIKVIQIITNQVLF